MEPQREKPWRRNAPNELIVNSILAAVSTIVVQTIVTSDQPRYWIGWLAAAVGSLFLFLISTERLAESIREDDIASYMRSSIFYNFAVLLLFVSLYAIFKRYAVLNLVWSVIIGLGVLLLWSWFWGWDAAFLIFGGERYDRWERKMDGEVIEGEVLDHYDIFLARITRWRRRD